MKSRFIIAVVLALPLLTACSTTKTHEEMLDQAKANIVEAQKILAVVSASAPKVAEAAAIIATTDTRVGRKLNDNPEIMTKINDVGTMATELNATLKKVQEVSEQIPDNTEVVEEPITP